MGSEQIVEFPSGVTPPWPEVSRRLSQAGFPVQMRMIDNTLSFPDEEPPATWQELRLGSPAGMITLRRQQGRVAQVVWGNADAPLLAARNAVAWALALVGDGIIEDAGTRLSAADFRQSAPFPEGFHG